jgi:hypothetical protein
MMHRGENREENFNIPLETYRAVYMKGINVMKILNILEEIYSPFCNLGSLSTIHIETVMFSLS